MDKKKLKLIITIKDQVITLEGFRSIVDIEKAGGVQMSTLRARVFGVAQADMNSITTLQWRPGWKIPNTVEVYAADDHLVFAGNIVNAWGDYQNMPQVFLHIQAQSAFYNQLKAIPPRSFKGGVKVADAIGQICEDLGYTFENNGVTTVLTDMYLPNTGMEQIKDIARAANCEVYLDDNVLAITPINESRGGDIPLISKDTGLVGYPTFDSVGVNFSTLFNPAIVFGGTVKLETDNLHAAGEWIVTSITHRLESERPGGAWFSYIRGNANGLAITSR